MTHSISEQIKSDPSLQSSLHPCVQNLEHQPMQRWVESARAINAERGWGRGFSLDVSPNPVVQWAMVGTEVLELQAELDETGRDLEEAGPGEYTKAEMELADIIVRCLDLTGLLQQHGGALSEQAWHPAGAQRQQLLVTPADQLRLATVHLKAIQGARKSQDPRIHMGYLEEMIELSQTLLSRAGVDPADCVRTKLQINSGREWMHGRRY